MSLSVSYIHTSRFLKGRLVLKPTRMIFGRFIVGHGDVALALLIHCKFKTRWFHVSLSFSTSSTPVENHMEPHVPKTMDLLGVKLDQLLISSGRQQEWRLCAARFLCLASSGS